MCCVRNVLSAAVCSVFVGVGVFFVCVACVVCFACCLHVCLCFCLWRLCGVVCVVVLLFVFVAGFVCVRGVSNKKLILRVCVRGLLCDGVCFGLVLFLGGPCP